MFRINLSHTKLEQIEEYINLIRSYSDIPICLDTQGAQVRTGTLMGGHVNLESGKMVDIVTSPVRGNMTKVPLYPDSVLQQLMVGNLISIDFDTVLLQVVETGPTCRGRVLSGGKIGSNKAVSIFPLVYMPPLTSIDYAAIETCLRLGIRHMALSFANHRSDVELLRGLVGEDVEIIAKIESRIGLRNLADIIDVTDAILIDRGDLSREIPLESLPFVQKQIIQSANKSKLPVYVATNLLESMVSSSQPTRAEVNDVINTLLDGADGLVLAAETSIGKHPVGCASMIRTLINQYEGQVDLSIPERNLFSTSRLITPHGGRLIGRVISGCEDQSLKGLPQLDIDKRTMMDVHQIAVGAFSPIEGFMGREVLESVLAGNKLPDGTVFPMPILLQLPAEKTHNYRPHETIVLTNAGKIWALLYIEECFTYNLKDLAIKWFGTDDTDHPGVLRLLSRSNCFLAGKVDLLSEYLKCCQPYEMTPAQSRLTFEHCQWQKVVGFHTRNVAHRAHEYLQLTALSDHHCDGIFIHPVIGPKKTGDFSGSIILKSYQHLIENYYPFNQAVLGGFMSYSRYAGPREALFTALCRKNYGCSHFVVGRDHTGVGSYYSPDASQRLLETVGDIGIQIIFFDEVYYCQKCMSYTSKCEHGKEFNQKISGTQARETLRQGKILPEWFMRESVSSLILEELKNGSEVFVN